MGRYLDIAKEVEANLPALPSLGTGNTAGAAVRLDGKPVHEVVWATERMIIFRDDEGRLWRYVGSWGKAWPVEIVSGAEPEGLRDAPQREARSSAIQDRGPARN